MDISQLSLDDVSSENHQVGARKQHGDLFTHHVDEYSFNESDTADHQEFVQPPLFEESDNSDDESGDQLLSSDISGDCQSDFVPSSSTSARPKHKSIRNGLKLSNRFLNKTRKSSLKQAGHAKCKCRETCMRKMSHGDIKSAQRFYWGKSPCERCQWLYEQF